MLVQKVKDFLSGNDIYDEEYMYDDEYMEQNNKQQYKQQYKEQYKEQKDRMDKHIEPDNESKVINLPNNNPNAIVITTPKIIEDATTIVKYILDNKIVAVNLEGVPQEEAQRIADFLGGAIHAINGDIQRISSDIFIIAPTNVDIVGKLEETMQGAGGFIPWLNRG